MGECPAAEYSADPDGAASQPEENAMAGGGESYPACSWCAGLHRFCCVDEDGVGDDGACGTFRRERANYRGTWDGQGGRCADAASAGVAGKPYAGCGEYGSVARRHL